jgi:hypothetical protein
MCVLITQYMCPHSTVYVSPYYCICPHTTIYVQMYNYMHVYSLSLSLLSFSLSLSRISLYICARPHANAVCVLRLMLHMCPHSAEPAVVKLLDGAFACLFLFFIFLFYT